ncbi:hypothetical protein H310_03403 [Aphanomyces invadans]|uniref:Tetraspanin n=1 Tax=Aphanomyces invadans TaxID=157072 RepID=A0A024UHB2_9STRA|nr:hypothetical protein H310_03403 [Aphanomyces invadans]ETW05684.1 hypothetical protein H310_03403 [Aphanomyces invadans]|eukprot:XP_008865461.1 hypothetical protein H310_03403 [Aphanomyces invadans]
MAIPTTLSKIVLVALNVVFIAAGALLIYIGVSFKGNQWSDVFSAATATPLNSLGLYTLIFGSVVVGIASLGIFGALCRNKVLLSIYAVFVFIALAVFSAFAVLTFMSASTASKWTAAQFPAATEETQVATSLNEVYCYAQGARLCTSASARDAFKAFVPALADTIVTVSTLLQINVDEKTGINGFCNQVDKQVAALGAVGATAAKSLPAQYKQVCDTCADVKNKYGDFQSIFDFAEEKCPLNPTTATFCGNFLLSKTQTNVFKSAPYEVCRPAILDLWHSVSMKLAIGSTIAAVVALILLFFACAAGKKDDYDRFSY